MGGERAFRACYSCSGLPPWHASRELAGHRVAMEKLWPPLPMVCDDFFHCTVLCWVSRAVGWCSRCAWDQHTENWILGTRWAQEGSARWCWRISPDFSRFFPGESKRRGRLFCSPLLAFWVNRTVPGMQWFWLMWSVAGKRRESTGLCHGSELLVRTGYVQRPVCESACGWERRLLLC